MAEYSPMMQKYLETKQQFLPLLNISTVHSPDFSIVSITCGILSYAVL